MQADDLYSLINLDLPGRVLPLFDGDPLTYADLWQVAGKYRGLYADTAADAAPQPTATIAYIPIWRRRRR